MLAERMDANGLHLARKGQLAVLEHLVIDGDARDAVAGLAQDVRNG